MRFSRALPACQVLRQRSSSKYPRPSRGYPHSTKPASLRRVSTPLGLEESSPMESSVGSTRHPSRSILQTVSSTDRHRPRPPLQEQEPPTSPKLFFALNPPPGVISAEVRAAHKDARHPVPVSSTLPHTVVVMQFCGMREFVQLLQRATGRLRRCLSSVVLQPSRVRITCYLAARPPVSDLLPAGPEESGICDELITRSMRYSGLTRDSK